MIMEAVAGAIIDSCVFIGFSSKPELIVEHTEGKNVYFFNEVEYEVFKYYHVKLRKRREYALTKTDIVLNNVFKAKKIGPNASTYDVFEELKHYLRLADISEKRIREERTDILVAAYGISYRMDVVSADNLFRVMEALFPDHLMLRTIPGLGSPLSPDYLKQLKANLRKHGVELPINLSSAP